MRWYAQRATTGEWLDRDIPFDKPAPTWGLSGQGEIRATISPHWEYLNIAEDGRPVFEQWGTLIFAEESNQIRWGGIVTGVRQQGEKLTVTAGEFGVYPRGYFYGGVYRAQDKDPLQVFRDLWSELQSWPDSNLGVTVSNDSSPARVGQLLRYEADLHADGNELWEYLGRLTTNFRQNPPGTDTPVRDYAREGLQAIRDGKTIFEDLSWVGMSDLAGRIVDTASFVFYQRHPNHDYSWPGSKQTVKKFFKDVSWIFKRIAPRPYEVVWWKQPDLGNEMDKLADQTPFDYKFEHSWSDSSKSSVNSRITLGYPRLGRRKFNLRFVEGENITDVVHIDRNRQREFSQDVVVTGSGEGRQKVRARVSDRDGRLRRPISLQDRTIDRNSDAERLARNELKARDFVREITSITVWNHPHAPFGSFDVGDDILVSARIGWSDISLWCRIVNFTYREDSDLIQLDLERSDSFTYNKGIDIGF